MHLDYSHPVRASSTSLTAQGQLETSPIRAVFFLRRQEGVVVGWKGREDEDQQETSLEHGLGAQRQPINIWCAMS